MLPRAQSPKLHTCPTCFKPEDQWEDCVNRQDGMCPPPVTVELADAAEVVCASPCGGPCGKHLIIPIGSVMKRRQLTNLGTCAFDVCRARLVVPSAKAFKGPPPIASDDAGGQ